jgi:glycosyltransferase involved in cell wall biosynthesis
MPNRLRRRLSARQLATVPANRIHTRPLSELRAIWRMRGGMESQIAWHRRAEEFQNSIPDRVLAAASAVIGFDTASWLLSQRANKLRIPMVLDQTTPHPDAKIPLYKLVHEQYPDWTDGVETRRPEVRAAEQEEYERATRIVAATSFTQRTLVEHGVAASKIRLNPYGVDCGRFQIRPPENSKRVRFIFVGLVNARKGIPLILDAWRKLKTDHAEFWVVGGASKQTAARLSGLRGLRYFGAVPHQEVASRMQQCDVFVFPSYFEGFGLVLLEAMACGLPVITTTNTVGPDVISEGQDGWVVAPGDLPALIEKMQYCLDRPSEVREMGARARKTAERFAWSDYGDRWIEILAEVCNARTEAASRQPDKNMLTVGMPNSGV